ncbi:MBOAT family protein [Seonamhaeicola algicola]|uniref:MBOAT family protein n=1 Tax=Seonamhaeicola algicola TaxID=1719036 RepID=A0A5C7AZS6_9FLAO|nr:MBOAT family O-acyltransferase [Seonamhaeicola algicola]TXE12999.1 MBOAT family protein [Seonamhaeicola algicola]
MLFNSIAYLIYFPVVVAVYFITPAKYRYIWLLISSYYFYMSWSPKYAVLMLFSTLVTYLSGVLIQRSNLKENLKNKEFEKKLWVALSFTINLGILFFFKYFNFINESFTSVFNYFGMNWWIPNFDVLLPVGISFYTFQALSYTMDVYREDIKAEHNFAKYALFVSFFPQLVAGPIEKSTHLLPQLSKHYKFNYERMKEGLILIGWGLFKKIVIADRLAAFVNTVYNNPNQFEGFTLVVATVFFSFQIYCDFSSYSDIAIGSAKVMGFDLMENFKRPYFSKSIAEFWRRWHISLGGWFRDYLYFPLGGNRVKKIIWYRNIMIVFLLSGLWHGASWNFVIWGALHGVFQVLSFEFATFNKGITKFLKIRKNSFSYKLYNVVITFVLVDFAWIFFRANNFADTKYILTHLFKFNPWVFFDGSLYNIGLDEYDFKLAIISILFLLFIDLVQRKYKLSDWIKEQHIFVRWGTYGFVIFFMIIFGYYGSGYDATEFIYFQF